MFLSIFKKPFILILSLFMFSYAQALDFSMPFSLDNQEVNHYLAEKVKVKNHYGFPGIFAFSYQISDLQAHIGKTPNKIEMGANINIDLEVAQEKFSTQLKLTFDTTPYYDVEKGAIYLKDFRILQWATIPQQDLQRVQQILPILNDSLAKLFENVPIYTLDENNIRDKLIKKFAKGIVVEKGKLAIQGEI